MLFRTGFGYHHIAEIEVIDDAVVVFGGSGECMYIEKFRCKDGAALMRFSTSY
jgi:hypothetical protein